MTIRKQRFHTNDNNYTTIKYNGMALSTIKPHVRELSTIKPHVRALSTVKPHVRALSTIKPHVRALSTIKPHVRALSTIKPHVRALSTIKPHVRALSTINTDRKALSTSACSDSSRLCGDSAVRNCVVERDYFPEEQHWNNTNASFPGSRFVPRFCRFKHDVIPPQLLQRCLQRKQMRRIAVIGDSQGQHYFNALKQMLNPIANCKQLRKDLWEHYFSRRKRRATKLPKQKSHKRYNLLFECNFVISSDKIGNDNEARALLPRSVLIEFISVISFTDRELPSTPSDCSPAPVHGAGRCNETQPRMLFPTLFGDYFARDNRYPDVILLFSNSHDKGMRKTVNKTRADIESLRDVVNRHVPRTTAFYWFSHHSENDFKKKPDWQHVHYEGKYTANEMIVRTNRALYTVLRDNFRNDRIRMFFDLYAMTLPLPTWSRDGVHFNQDWYKYLMSYWFQTTCSKFM